MSEILCPLCNAQSPENALYCQQCGQPLRCKECGKEILPNARACIHCGKLIPERASSQTIQVGMHVVPPGYNHLKFHETPDERDLDLTVSNEAIAQIGDFLPSILTTRLKKTNGSGVDNQSPKQADVVEVTSDIPKPQPQLPAAPLQPSLPQDAPEKLIWEIFRKQEGGALRQDIPRLKAPTKKDYLIRLTYLYLYAKHQLGEDTVPRAEVYPILDIAGVKDGNTAKIISQDTGISADDHETLRLNYDGHKQIKHYIADVFNDELPDGWLPGADTRSAPTRTKKPSKKNNEQTTSLATDVARWVSHEITRILHDKASHSTIDAMSIQNQALLALYGIYKAGTEHEISVTSIAKYLYDAFEVQVDAQAMSTAFYKARKGKSTINSYVNFVQGHGYKITASGREHIEELLNLKQPKVATDVNAGSNGAVQSENNTGSA